MPHGTTKPYFLLAKPAITLAMLNSRRHAGLSFWADQTMLKGSLLISIET